jgi:hypothetical protein
MSWAAWSNFMRANPRWFDGVAFVNPPSERKPTMAKAPRGISADEAVTWLRDQGELAQVEWPWLRDLVRDRVRQVGFGPWK